MNAFHSSQSPVFAVLKRLMAIVLLVMLALPLFPAHADEMGTLTAKVVLRKSADKDSKALQTLPKGDEVVLLNTSGDWYKVNYGSYTGYVMKKYVKVSKNSVVANTSQIEALGDAPGALKIGYAGEDVKKLQKALNILGYYKGKSDGDYGADTTAAVSKYQKDKGLEADGVAGKETITSIFGSCAKTAKVTTAGSSSDSKSSSSNSSSSGKTSSANKVSSMEEIGSAPAASKEGDSGTKVKKLQQALELLGYYSGDIDGNYGAKTVEAVKRLQKNRGMKEDGIAGASTIRVLFGGISTLEKASSSTSKVKTYTTEVLDWFKDDVARVIPKSAKFTIKDIRTGKTFTAVRWSGGNHIDAEPATKDDTKTMKNAYGGAWSWNRRPILIQYNGHVYAASMNGMPHGSDDTISDNDFAGVFCIHFKNSKTHGTDKVDPDHQKAVTTASKASW